MSDNIQQSSIKGKGRRVSKSGGGITKIAIIIIAVVVVLLVGASAFAASYDKIFPGVHVGTVDVGGLTVGEAEQKISQNVHAAVHDVVVNWTVDGEQHSYSVTLGGEVDASAAAGKAYNVGREDGFFGRIGAFFGKKDAKYPMDVDRASIDDVVVTVAAHVDAEPVPYNAEVRGGQLSCTMGIPGASLDRNAAANHIEQAIGKLSGQGGASLDLTQFIVPTSVETPDVEALFKSVHAGAKNAEYSYGVDDETGKTTVSITPAVMGYTFDKEQAKQLLAAGQDFSLPVTETPPSVTESDLEEALFRDVLSETKTSLNKYNYNRTGNVKLSAEAINETILAPGEEFSYNKIVGERTFDRGYRDALVYVAAGMEEQLGGGICQTSSTLYMSVIRARLEIVYRANHAYTVAYTPLGEDATVYWGSTDFNFKNNREYPVKVVAVQEDNYLIVKLLGTAVDDLTVDVQLEVHSSAPYHTIERENHELEYGTTKQVVEGHSGYSVTTYAIVKDKDGNQVDRYKLADSRYRRLDRIIEIGMKGAPAVTDPLDPTIPVVSDPTTPPVESNPPTDETPPIETQAPLDDEPTAPPSEEPPFESATDE